MGSTRVWRTFALALCAGMLSRAAVPLAAVPPSEGDVGELMELSGLEAQIPRIPIAIVLGFDRQKGRLEAALAERVRRELDAAYDAGTLAERVRRALIAGWDAEAMAAARTWLASEPGRRLTTLELAGTASGNEKELRDFTQGLNENHPDPARVEAVAHIIHAARLNESAMDQVMAVMTAAMIGVNAGQPPEQQLTPLQIAAVMRETRKNFAEPLRNELLVRSLFTYREAAQTELERYAEYLDSPAAAYVNGLLAKALRGATQAAAADFAARLNAEVNAKADH